MQFHAFHYTTLKRMHKNPTAVKDARQTLGHIDYYISLSVFMYDFNLRGYNQRLCIPEILPDSELNIRGKNIRHPLIPEEKCVGNDFQLHRENPVVLLTGSNMSGKSTFLRTLALNYILANMGCGVFADSFQFSRMSLLCSIRINDSLKESISLFYQEVLKLKYILDTIEKQKPCLVLIDEMLKGTNTKERRIASEAIIKYLSKSMALSVIATHDLELTEVRTRSALKNYHFRESITGDKMFFDYKMHEGVLKTSNALKILQLSGINIDFIH